jgi:hypothetical protein
MKNDNVANPSLVKSKKKKNKHGRLKPEAKNSLNTLLVNSPKEKWYEIELEVRLFSVFTWGRHAMCFCQLDLKKLALFTFLP